MSDMVKWHDNPLADDGVIISSRVRLARNLRGYPFERRMGSEQTRAMLDEIKEKLIENGNVFDAKSVIEAEGANSVRYLHLLEKHILSLEFIRKKGLRAAAAAEDESYSIMINEEDHIRLQSVFPSEGLDEAYALADDLDNLVDERLEYAYDKNYGYLTSCPTNTGTGLRASYMLHIPMLESTKQMQGVVNALAKFGLTIRGIYGEGSEPQGSVYQVSNQVTLGKSEKEIMQSLKNLTQNIISQENALREKCTANSDYDFIDRIYRSYGILVNARKLDKNEAVSLLSNVRLGFLSGVLDAKRPSKTIYSTMIDIQPGNLSLLAGKQLTDDEGLLFRAEYIRKCFN